MTEEVACGPLTARLRECWVRADNLRVSAERPGWCDAPLIHAIVVEWVSVEEAHRRRGHFRRFIEAVCADPRFDMVIVEAVQNAALAEALLRWGWDCDPGVMDFYQHAARGEAAKERPMQHIVGPYAIEAAREGAAGAWVAWVEAWSCVSWAIGPGWHRFYRTRRYHGAGAKARAVADAATFAAMLLAR